MISEGSVISVIWCPTLFKAQVSVVVCFHLAVWSQPVCISVACCFINCVAFLLQAIYMIALVTTVTCQPIIIDIRGFILTTHGTQVINASVSRCMRIQCCSDLGFVLCCQRKAFLSHWSQLHIVR